MNGVGRLAVRATLQGGRLTALAVQLHRPPVARLLVGQTPGRVCSRVAGLYTLCTQAQGAAAQAALARAQGQPVPPLDVNAAWTEVLHEHLWRLLLDWPQALGLPPEPQAFAAWRAARHTAGAAQATRRVLDNTLAPLAQRCLDRLPPAGTGALALAPPFDPQEWLAHGAGGPRPAWPCPTSVTQAYAARVQDLHTAADAAARGDAYPLVTAEAQGWALAQTLTARGALTHAVRMGGDLVQDYRIWAPTDLFFSDASALADLLAEATFDSPAQARQALAHAVLALDPCLPFDMEIEHA